MQVVVPTQATQPPPERPHWAFEGTVMQLVPAQHPAPQLLAEHVNDRQLPFTQV
jgi:hypothetical protein